MILRSAIAHGCHWAGALALTERVHRDELTILTYHRVLPADRRSQYFNPGLVVTPESFRVHCGVLQERYTVLPLSEAVERWRGGDGSDRPLAAITFDDGYRDNYRLAAPILGEFGLRATFFIVAGLIGTPQPPWYDRLARVAGAVRTELLPEGAVGGPTASTTEAVGHGLSPAAVIAVAKRLPPEAREALLEQAEAQAPESATWHDDDLIMDGPRLRRLVDAGHELGSHSQTHELLPLLDDSALQREVAASRAALADHTGTPVRSFCYPNGDTDDRVVAAVTAAGYICATTTESGCNPSNQDLFRLRRRFIHEDRLTGPGGRRTARLLLRAELCGLADQAFGRNWRRRR